jgi:3',5'-cyclic-AMP phosphodiesterase
MPISLPPITRRKFLARTLTAAAGLALAPRLLANGKETDPDFLALFSDTHIAADRAHISHGANMADNMTTSTRELMAMRHNPAGVFVTGDCAFDTGTTDDYGTFAQLLTPLREEGMPVHLTLGNHDNRKRFWDALTEEKLAQRPLADKQAMLLQTPRANWFMLDSLEKTNYTPGMLGKEQLDWLAASLDASGDKPALILVHHNPGFHGKVGGLKDAEAMFKVIRPRKQVKVCIYGHTHDWHVWKDDSGIHLINLPPVAYVFEEGKPSGWVRATLGDDKMEIELRCVNPKHPAQGQKKTLDWRV